MSVSTQSSQSNTEKRVEKGGGIHRFTYIHWQSYERQEKSLYRKSYWIKNVPFIKKIFLINKLLFHKCK